MSTVKFNQAGILQLAYTVEPRRRIPEFQSCGQLPHVEAARTAAQAALDHALENVERCRRAAADHERRLAELCQAARVDEPEQLPEAEERSRRKREAQAEFDRSSAQLAQASRRPVDELRSLLRDYDAGVIRARIAELARTDDG